MYQRKKKSEGGIKKVLQNSAGVAGTAAVMPMLAITNRGKGPINSLLTGTAKGVQKGLRGKINRGAAAVGKRIMPNAVKNQAKNYTKGAINENLTLQTLTGLGAGSTYAGIKGIEALRNRQKNKKR